LVEVKLASGGIPSLAETLSAFGNMPSGGTVILGVEESAGFAITGVADIASLEAGIAAQARTAVSPPVHTDFDVVDIEGKSVLVVTVTGLPAADKPCRTHGKAYLRQADGDYAMSAQEIAQMVTMQDRPRHDAVVMEGSAIDDLDAELTNRFLAESRASSRRLAEHNDGEVLRLRNVARQTGLTLAGLYAMGSYPQQFAPCLAVTAAAAPIADGQRISDLAHLSGPIPDLLEQSVDWVRRNTRTAVAFGADGHGVDQPEIPLVAVRELVANALIHRDLSPWTQSKGVEIRLLPDRLVVTNPGGLWGVSREQLGTPRGKSAVNEFLYDMCRSIRTDSGHRIVEGEGGGIREAIQALRQAGLAEPIFVDTGVSFTAIIYRPATALPPTPSMGASHSPWPAAAGNAQTVLAALAGNPCSILELTQRTGLTRRQVKYALDRLVESGQVIINGGQGNRFTTYRLA